MDGVLQDNVEAKPATRAAFARAVREREQELTTRFDRAGWRTGTLLESDGAASLRAAFGAVA